jgi:Uma2 family endonuclease
MASVRTEDFGLSSSSKPLPDGKLSEAEFLSWCDEGGQAEWVDGQVIVAAPPTSAESDLMAFLLCLLSLYVEDRNLGEVFGAPLTARLSPRCRRVPDVMFVANERLPSLQPTHLEGPPDLAIEIVSRDSVERDWREKFYDYQAAGVHEYWIVDPAHQRLEAYQLVDGKYRRVEHEQGRIASAAINGFHLREEWLWRTELPRVRDALEEIETAG